MDNIWDSIPDFRNQSTTEIFDIDVYLNKFYENKKLYLYETYKDNIADKMLNDYVSKLSDLKKLYSTRFTYLFNNFKQNLEENKDKSILKIILNGPDDHYTIEENLILNKALNNFCSKLSNKNYPYDIKEEQKIVNDFMDGTCTISYKVIEITLK
jgi:hypothetical protein